MRYLLIGFMLILFNARVTAQRRTVKDYKDKWAIRISPIALVDVFDNNLTVGTAYALNNRWTISTDLSYIFYSAYIENKKRVSGYIVKPALRYYLSEKRKFFVEAAPFYKRAGYKIHDWLGMDAVTGVPSYQELKTFIFRKQVTGLNVMFGVQKSLVRSNSLRMEIYAGIGVRYKWQDVKHDSRAVYLPNELFEASFYDPKIFGAGIPHGLRIVYVLK